MMKKIIFTGALFLYAVSAFAQFTLGPKAAVNFSSFSIDVAELEANRLPGFDAGLFLRIGGKLYVQPEVLYSHKQVKVRDHVAGKKDIAGDIQTQTVGVPVLLGLQLINFGCGNLRVFAGPKLSFLLDNNFQDTFRAFPNFEDNPKSATWNYSGLAGIGIDVGILTLDLRYDFSFNNLATADDAHFRTNAFVASLGIKLF